MARPCSVSAVLLLTVAVGVAGYGRLRPSQNGRLFHGVHFVYEGKTTRESDLPPCPSAASVCSLVHRRFWQPELSQRLCRCSDGQCPYEYSNSTDERTLQLNNRIQLKFCGPVRSLRRCGPHPAIAAVLERRTDAGPLRLDHERKDVKVNCSCPYPSRYQKVSEWGGGGSTEVTAYTCRQLEPCSPGEVCGHIRMDTYSTYHTCLCPPNHLCLFREQRRVKVKRDVEELFYDSTAYVGECRILQR
ncbi:U-scoloptoxin(11)-Sm7a-like [Amphibalanus amphitrite]|uniref:U-scoloptoxin(11)-Sm7a-like n=1 Tax=Amphibalanus amphitrite TaxID=1232801 RepID=UPI001C90592E|nr:U-scoloptoxin(11)-Sm7a-like [Amphibalanus amphitrite]